MRVHDLVALTLCASASVMASAYGQAVSSGPSRGAFITRLGVDTLYVERYVRDRAHLEGDIAVFNPETRVTHYRVDFAPNGRVARFALATRDPKVSPDSTPAFERVSVIRDSVLETEVRSRGVRADNLSSRAIVHGPAVPFISISHATYELAVLHALGQRRDSVALEMFGAGPQPVFPLYVKKLYGDSVLVSWGPVLRGRLGRDGSLLSLDQSATTVKTMAERVGDLDFDGIVRRRISLEQSGNRAGLPSPRDTIRAAVQGATLWVDYGRPSRRGRRIFGALVPLDSVWRTGANAATQFETSRDLVVSATGDERVVIPAGRYTLWTIPQGPTGPVLIVNKQTGQWGTQYDPQQDLARLPLAMTRRVSTLERFTIAVEDGDSGGGGGGILRFSWDDRDYLLRFKVM